MSLLVPVFVTYTSIMFKDAVRHRHPAGFSVREPRVTRRFQWLSYLVLTIYLFSLLTVISLHPSGVLSSGKPDSPMYGNSESYQRMTALVALVESGLGLYIGQIVLALFKKED